MLTLNRTPAMLIGMIELLSTGTVQKRQYCKGPTLLREDNTKHKCIYSTPMMIGYGNSDHGPLVTR